MENVNNEAAAVWVPLSELHEWENNPRENQPIDKVANSIKRFGFASPIIARKNGEIIAGHTRFRAAQSLGLERVPVRFMDLDPADAKLLALADNKIGELADWDDDKLADILKEIEEEDLSFLDFDLEFDVNEIIEEDEQEPEIEFSEYIGEANNYIVLIFDNEMDWMAANEHFNLKQKICPTTNGEVWNKGVGRVVNGAKYIERVTK